MMKPIEDALGANARQAFPDALVDHVGGRRYRIHTADGRIIRYLADEGDGSFDAEDGFDEAWDADGQE